MHALKMQEPAALQTECLHRLVGMRAEDWQDAGRKFHAACAYDRQVAAAKCAAEAEIAAQQTTHKTSKRRSPLLCMPPAKTRRIDKEKPKPRRTRMWDCAPTGGVPVVRAAPDVLEHDSATVGTHAVRRVLTILGLQSVPFHQQYIASVLHHLVYALASASLHGIIKSARSTINACARVLLPHLVLRTLEHWADPSLQLGDMRRDVEAACNEFAALADGDVEEDFCGPEAEFESRELQKLCSPCALLLIRMVPFDAVAVPSESADFATGDGWFWKRAEEVATKPRRPCSGLTVHCTDFSHVGSLVSFRHTHIADRGWATVACVLSGSAWGEFADERTRKRDPAATSQPQRRACFAVCCSFRAQCTVPAVSLCPGSDCCRCGQDRAQLHVPASPQMRRANVSRMGPIDTL
eukprot:TRINITY_DN10838_c0_g1_i1.p1 TRINITY_DN10838_c0_g1~~TRINITY_DN10838_c0_g1_i1.p1  ORF type:complete len:409 (+),score=22.48 TRINITY_DN10838_c0_g1_i1:43-1269(+)